MSRGAFSILKPIAAPRTRRLETSYSEESVQIVNARGLHARAAAKLVKLANTFDVPIEICCGNVCVPAASILGLMTLAASQNSIVTIRGPIKGSESAIRAIAELIGRGFDE